MSIGGKSDMGDEIRKGKVPSAIRIMMSDYAAFLGIAIMVVPWAFPIMTIAGVLEDQDSSDLISFLVIAFVATVLGAVLLYWRVGTVRRVFERGVMAEGTIVGIWFTKDRGRVSYRYNFQGKEYTSGKGIMKNSKTASLDKGMTVSLIVDPENPQRAYISDLYF
jgi:hypothetical protein